MDMSQVTMNVIAIAITASIVILSVLQREVPPSLSQAFVLILGFYFGVKVGGSNGQTSKPVDGSGYTNP